MLKKRVCVYIYIYIYIYINIYIYMCVYIYIYIYDTRIWRYVFLQKHPKQGLFAVALFMVTFNYKMIAIKNIFTSNISLINL